MSINIKFLIAFLFMFVFIYFFMGFVPALIIPTVLIGGILISHKTRQRGYKYSKELFDVRYLVKQKTKISVADVAEYLNINQKEAQSVVDRLRGIFGTLEDADEVNGEKFYKEKHYR